jgi:tetratricopeptide (TPR) repeat protein
MAKPDSIVAQLNEAVALHRRGEIGLAAQLYQHIIDRDPRNADAYQLLGVIARQMNRRSLALQLMVAALEINPHHAAALTNHALLLREAGDLPAAKTQAEAAVRADPHYADAHSVLGGILQAERSWIPALEHFRTAVRLQPENPALLNNIATVERRLGHLPAAYAAVTRAIQINPDMAELYNTQGNILRAAGYPDAACATFTAAYERDPALHDAMINEALARLMIGDFTHGWELFARRGKPDPRTAQIPAWDGTTDPEACLLVQAEQGLGDALQFVRLLPWAASRVRNIILEVPPLLQQLMQRSFSALMVITPEASVPPAVTHQCRLLDLAGFVPINDRPVPGSAPYLIAPEFPLPEILQPCVLPRIGLVWAGNPGHLNDVNRSLQLRQLVEICRPFTKHLVSLQKGQQCSELAATGLEIFDAAPLLEDFSTTAGVLRYLDLVITVDTSVAHLAGAMGKPVWIMLPFDPDWRWQLERRDVPWYPTAKLYRQPSPGDWDAVIAAVGHDLARFIAGSHDVLSPPAWIGMPPRRQLQSVILPGFDA